MVWRPKKCTFLNKNRNANRTSLCGKNHKPKVPLCYKNSPQRGSEMSPAAGCPFAVLILLLAFSGYQLFVLSLVQIHLHLAVAEFYF